MCCAVPNIDLHGVGTEPDQLIGLKSFEINWMLHKK